MISVWSRIHGPLISLLQCRTIELHGCCSQIDALQDSCLLFHSVPGIREPRELISVLHHRFGDITTLAAIFRDAHTQPQRESCLVGDIAMRLPGSCIYGHKAFHMESWKSASARASYASPQPIDLHESDAARCTT